MIRVLTGLLLLVSWLSVTAQVKPTKKVKVKYDYLIYLPKDYNVKQTTYPLVIYLHGGAQRGKDLNKLKAYGLPYLVDQGRDFDFIIASPQCPEGKYWTTNDWFDSLYTELKTKYRIDPKRVYLTGISIGGYGTWHTTIDYPDTFAAIVPLCGGVNDSTQVCRIRQVPVWTFHGTADDAIPIAETERVVNTLKQCQGNVKFTKLANEGHGIQYLYEKNDIYDWLLRQHR